MNSKQNWLQFILFGVLILASILFLLKPIVDYDFFWHLKTGEWIWQNGKLPDQDMFSYTGPAIPSASARFILTSYWFSQLMLHAAVLWNGMTGIILFRFLIAATLIAAMIRRKQGDGVVYAALLVLFAVSTFKFYAFERPQVLSFLFFGILLFILEKIKADASTPTGNDSARPAVSLALLMLVWANSHGGHIIGQVTLLVFLVMEGVKFIHPSLRPMAKKGYRYLLIAGISGIVFSFINPNTYHVFEFTMSYNSYGNSPYTVNELLPMIGFFNLSHDYVVFLYLFFMALSVVVLASSPKEIDITQVTLLLGIGSYSFMHIRYAVFFPIAALPMLGNRLSRERVIRWSRSLIVPLALFSAIFFAQDEFTNITSAKEGRWIDNKTLPVEAANFIDANNINGNMYNYYDWGGYLIWRLAPERKVFIDGRSLDANVFWESMLIGIGHVKRSSGEQVWKSLLQKYGVTYILTNTSTPDGSVNPLVNKLLMDAEWVPVFYHQESNSMVLVKDVPANFEVIQKYAIPKYILGITL